MFLSVHINSIDLGGATRAANPNKLELWVSAQPTKRAASTPPIEVSADSLLSINKDYTFELNPNIIRDQNLLSLKVSILRKRFIGSEHICDVEFDFLRLPKNQAHRSLVTMVAHHQTEQPILDIVVNLADQPDNCKTYPYQNTNLENYLKVAGIAASGAVTGTHGSSSRLACETSIFSDMK